MKMNTSGKPKYSTSIIFSTAIISMLLIGINFFTIKILSSIRSYAHGESIYSKGQKDATRNLLLLVTTRDTTYYQKFVNEINVPIGDSIARVALTDTLDVEAATKGFLQGRNHPEDIKNLIWLLKKFGNYKFMSEPIHVWKKADVTIGKTARLGKEAYQKVLAGNLSLDEEKYFIEKAVEYTNESTVQERLFLEALGKISRVINRILFISNFILTGLLLGGITLHNWFVVKRISKQKEDLNRLNKQLDEFLYSATHDLRAPISSLMGLVHIAKLSQDPVELHGYMNLMEQVLEKQEAFIKQIIEVSKNEKTETAFTEVNFENLVDKAVDYHLHMPQATRIEFRKDISAKTFQTDALRIEIILNNLLSNAIKYNDSSKPDPFIKVSSYCVDKHFVFEVEDNGIGIDAKHVTHIFDIFYVANQNKLGSGIGLYLTSETVRKLGGEIKVKSELNKGTKFTVSFPQKK